MKSFYTAAGLLLWLLITIPSTGQYKKNSDRYRLDLPKEWLRPKMLVLITDILPQTIEELKEREFCTEGNAAYCVHLVLDSVNVRDEITTIPVESGRTAKYRYSFKYRFYGSLALFDSLGKPVSSLRLVSTEEEFYFTKEYQTALQNPVYVNEHVYDTSGNIIGQRRAEVPGTRISNPHPRHHSAYQLLTEELLRDICKKKLFEMRAMLRKLNLVP